MPFMLSSPSWNHVLQDANHLVGNAIDANAFADGILPGKQLLLHVISENSDAAMGEVFLLAKETSFAHFHAANLLVAGVGSADVVVVAARAVSHAALLVHLRGHALQRRHFRAHIVEIVVRQA